MYVYVCVCVWLRLPQRRGGRATVPRPPGEKGRARQAAAEVIGITAHGGHSGGWVRPDAGRRSSCELRCPLRHERREERRVHR